jgi:hypothetical protein
MFGLLSVTCSELYRSGASLSSFAWNLAWLAVAATSSVGVQLLRF